MEKTDSAPVCPPPNGDDPHFLFLVLNTDSQIVRCTEMDKTFITWSCRSSCFHDIRFSNLNVSICIETHTINFTEFQLWTNIIKVMLKIRLRCCFVDVIFLLFLECFYQCSCNICTSRSTVTQQTKM